MGYLERDYNYLFDMFIRLLTRKSDEGRKGKGKIINLFVAKKHETIKLELLSELL